MDGQRSVDGLDTDIKVNDTLLASGLREGGQPLQVLRLQSSATQSNRSTPYSTTPTAAPVLRGHDPRWAAHAATTAQVPHD